MSDRAYPDWPPAIHPLHGERLTLGEQLDVARRWLADIEDQAKHHAKEHARHSTRAMILRRRIEVAERETNEPREERRDG